jgi:DNA-3-methyladenine glycosylase
VTLPRRFYARSPLVVAPALLGKVLLAADGRSGRITEVEAYCGTDDPASHAYRGRTARNDTMWRGPGLLYVYFTYGMHWCANATCTSDGDACAGAVLIRALEPLSGLEAMRRARWRSQRHQTDRDLCRGPARLCQALGWDRTLDGADLVTIDRGVRIGDDGTPPPPVAVTTRIGLSVAIDRPWRFVVAGSPWVSGPAVRDASRASRASRVLPGPVPARSSPDSASRKVARPARTAGTVLPAPKNPIGKQRPAGHPA